MYYFAIAICFILASCDPAKQIILKNKSDNQVSFKMTIEGDSIPSNSNHSAIKNWTYNLGTEKNEKEAIILFGFGNWRTEEIERFVDKNIKSIEIDAHNAKVKMTDKGEMKKFLTDRRHGLFRNFITIRIK